MLFHLHTSYLVPRYNTIRRIQWPKCLCQRSRSTFPQNGLNTKQLAISWMLFQPQTSSYLFLQLFCDSFGRCPFVSLELDELIQDGLIMYNLFHLHYFTNFVLAGHIIWSFQGPKNFSCGLTSPIPWLARLTPWIWRPHFDGRPPPTSWKETRSRSSLK